MIIMGELTKDEINQLVRKYVKEELNDFSLWQATGKRGNSDTIDEDLLGFDTALDHYRMGLAERNHVKIMSRKVDDLLSDMEISIIDKDSDAYKLLCYELTRAEIRILEACMNRFLGKTEGTDPDTIINALGVKEQGNTISLKPEQEKPSILLADLIERYKSGKLESKRWSENTIKTHQPKIKAMIQYFDNKPVNYITKQDFMNFAEVLELLPPFYIGFRDISGLMPEDLRGKYDKTLDVTTRITYLKFVRSIFKYAEDMEYVKESPVLKRLIPEKKKNTREQRLPFDDKDLERIFNPEIYLKWSAMDPIVWTA